MNNGNAPLFMLVINERNITMKATIPQNPSFRSECASSPTRNKAKNALSLAATISPVLAGAKIGKIWIGQGGKQIFSSKCLRDGKMFVNLPPQNPPSLINDAQMCGSFYFCTYDKPNSFSETLHQFPHCRHGLSTRLATRATVAIIYNERI